MKSGVPDKKQGCFDAWLQVMHLCYSGDLVVESSENGEVSSRFARKWEIFGLQAALGLRSGPADYKLLAGRAGCTLVKVTWPAVQQAGGEFKGTMR